MKMFMKFLLWRFAEKCPQGKRGRPMSMSPEVAEQKGIQVCEKQTRDGRTIAYKTGQQLAKEKESKSLTKEARQKSGLKQRGRLSQSNKEKIAQMVEELRSLRSSTPTEKTKTSPGRKKIIEKPVEKPASKPVVSKKSQRISPLPEELKKYRNQPLEQNNPNVLRMKEKNRQPEDVDNIRKQMPLFRPKSLRSLGISPEQNKKNMSGIAKAFFNIVKKRPTAGDIDLPDIFFEAKKWLPDLTIEQFKNTLFNMKQDELLDLRHINSPGGDGEPEFGITPSYESGTIYYASVRPNTFPEEEKEYKEIQEIRQKKPGESWESYDKRMDEFEAKLRSEE